MDKMTEKMWCIYATEYYSAVKMNETLSFVTTLMSLGDIILCEARQAQKNKYYT
jgi:hypothetical protein